MHHWLVKFTRREMEPLLPFRKTSAIVCAATREDAKEKVPASPCHRVTASKTTMPVTSPHHCFCNEVTSKGPA